MFFVRWCLFDPCKRALPLADFAAESFFQVLTFCPTQLGHFRGVLKLSLGGDILVIPIRVIGEASTVGTKQPR